MCMSHVRHAHDLSSTTLFKYIARATYTKKTSPNDTLTTQASILCAFDSCAHTHRTCTRHPSPQHESHTCDFRTTVQPRCLCVSSTVTPTHKRRDDSQLNMSEHSTRYSWVLKLNGQSEGARFYIEGYVPQTRILFSNFNVTRFCKLLMLNMFLKRYFYGKNCK